ncbi:unnamed protein product [Coffea canephora]|uniref:Protein DETOXIFICATION n=2 Tax=Coffea TaxID=13442 RepID=A0A068TU16_COFCA|nr:protein DETOXIFICATION 55 [Coffea arabica]CDO98843.1 unnamed protein product [Coffea canephora]
MEAEQTKKSPTVSEVIEELKKMKDISFPIFAIGLAGYLKNMISVTCMGRLGSLELAGGALAIGFTNITGYSVLSGLAMGMEPLCSQAFGSRNTSIASLILRRTILMLLVASLPIGLLWINLKPLMLRLHQDPEVVDISSIYCRFAIPDLIANSLLHPIRIYSRSKGITWPLLWCTLLAIILHLPITTFLTFNLHLGIQGIAISISVANFNTLFFLLAYLLYYTYAPSEALSKPLAPKSNSTSLGEDWRMLLRLSLPSCLAVCLEWWWYEIMTLLAGYLERPQVALATSAIVIQTTSLMYTLPSALSASISTRVGNELGAGRPYKARLATVVGIGLAFITSVFGFLLTTIGREAWGRIFTKDTEVLELTLATLPIIGLCELANCPQTTCCGVLRGTARPCTAAGINFYSFYLMGTPVAIALAFFWGQGFLGLCYGLLAAQVACMVSILTVISKTDWERESQKAVDLVGETCENRYQDEIAKCEEGHNSQKQNSFEKANGLRLK